MSCTCFQKKYPCSIHHDKPLAVPEIVVFETIVIHLKRRWETNENWFGTIAKDAIQKYQSQDFKTRPELIEDLKKHL